MFITFGVMSAEKKKKNQKSQTGETFHFKKKGYVSVVKKSEAIERLREIISISRREERQEKVWDYLLFFSSAFVVSSGLYAAFLIKSFFMAAGWIVSLYWILSTVKFRRERDAYRHLWLGALEEFISIGGDTPKEKENK
jgi:hypothetical protein